MKSDRPTISQMRRMPAALPCPSCESEAVEAHSTGDDLVVRCCDCLLTLRGRKVPTERLDKRTGTLAKALRMDFLDTAYREAQVMLLVRWNALTRHP